MKDKKWDYETCFNYVKERRNIIKPNEGFKKQLIDYYNKNIATLIKENNNIENKNEIFEKNNNIENNINNENNIENNNNENNFENNNDK